MVCVKLWGAPSLTLDVMLVVLEVWQAILVKKLDLDSSWVKQSMSEGARNLLKVGLPCPFFTPPLPLLHPSLGPSLPFLAPCLPLHLHSACLLSLFPLLLFGYLSDGVCHNWCRFESVQQPMLKVCPLHVHPACLLPCVILSCQHAVMAEQSMSEGARNLLKVGRPCPPRKKTK